MYQALIIFHILVALAIIGFVLIQQGKGADAGAAFGSGASGTLFGARGASSFLSRSTAILAVLFFSTSLLLAILGGAPEKPRDLMDVPEMGAAPVTDLPDLDQPVSDLPEDALDAAPGLMEETLEAVSDAVPQPKDLPAGDEASGEP